MDNKLLSFVVNMYVCMYLFTKYGFILRFFLHFTMFFVSIDQINRMIP